MNSIIIKGRLALDPELRKTQSDVSVCSFDVAVDRGYTNPGEDKITDWFRCNAWRQQGEFISKYFTKGQEILIRGEMQSRKYVDKDGNNRVAWEVQVDRAEFCGNKAQGKAQGDPMSVTPPAEEAKDDNLPF